MSLRPSSLSKLAKRMLIALLLINIGFIFYYIFVNYKTYFHSDSAAKSLIAQEIYETGQYFPSDWYYINGDLWVLSGHTYIVPMLSFFSNSYSLHAVSGVFSAALILLGTWCVSSVICESIITRLASMVVVSSGISDFMAENLYGQVSYGIIYYSTCFLIFFTWKFLNEESKVRWLWGVGVATLVGLIFLANPQRALPTYGLPLIAASLMYLVIGYKKSGGCRNTRSIRGASLLGTIFIGMTAGILLHLMIIAGVNNTPGAGAARWLSFDEMLQNIGYTLQGILAIFGGLPTEAASVVSLRGAYEGVRLITAIALVSLLPYGLILALRGSKKSTQFFAIYALVSVFIFSFLQITTTVPDMSDPVQSSRYLIPSLLLLLLLLVAKLDSESFNQYSRVVTSVALIFIATGAFSSLLSSRPINQVHWGMTGQLQSDRIRIIDFLTSNGLHYGYSSYWNAGVLSVLSEQNVRVRQINIINGLPIPMRAMSSERWYRPSAWKGKTFLLLTDDEAKVMKWDLLARYHGKPERKLQFQNLNIYVFSRNIAIGLPNWDLKLEKPVRFEVSSQSPHQVGRYIVEHQQPALIAEKGETGYLYFGPYVSLQTGSYKVSFEVETDDHGVTNFGRLDVVSDKGRKIHSFTSITYHGSHSYSLEFQLMNKAIDMEFRVLTTGAGRVNLYGISVERTDV